MVIHENRGLNPYIKDIARRLAKVGFIAFAPDALFPLGGFLAAGLIWGLTLGVHGFEIKVFFLSCVVVAGVYGAATVGRAILFVQALPAAIGLTLLLLG